MPNCLHEFFVRSEANFLNFFSYFIDTDGAVPCNLLTILLHCRKLSGCSALGSHEKQIYYIIVRNCGAYYRI